MLINGVPAEQLSVYDRGLQYGDGLFETVAVRDGVPLLWERHLQRLSEGCRRLAIALPDIGLLTQQAHQLCAAETKAVLKLILTRGVGGRGYRSTAGLQPTVIMAISDWPGYPADYASKGVRIRTCQLRLSQQPSLAGIKHLNRLEQVLARQEWEDADIVEGVMCDASGRVIEGIISNLFFIKGGALFTPDLSQCGVAGIMRQLVIEACAEQRIECHIGPVSLEQAQASEAILMSNSLIQLWPVRHWDDKTYPVATEIISLLNNHINKKC